MTATITADMVKTLRDKTGAGMMDVRNALSEAAGDMEKAAEILRQKGIASADNKSGRATSEGLVSTKITPDAKKGVIIEVNCETDFVARNENFVGMVDALAGHALASSATSTDTILAETMTGQSVTVGDYVKENIAVIKENLSFARFAQLSVAGEGCVQSYIHTGGKIGVLLAVTAPSADVVSQDSFKQLVKDLTLHIASFAPEFVNVSDIPGDYVENEKRIEMGKEDLQSKPIEIREKIVMGRLDKLLAQRVLLQQPFVKDPNKTVEQQVKDACPGAAIQAFYRFALGELQAESASAE